MFCVTVSKLCVVCLSVSWCTNIFTCSLSYEEMSVKSSSTGTKLRVVKQSKAVRNATVRATLHARPSRQSLAYYGVLGCDAVKIGTKLPILQK